jgi:hypothetical protein
MKFLRNIKSTFIGLAALMLAPSIACADQFALMDRVESGSGVEVTLGTIILEEADGIVLKNDYHLQLGLDDIGVYALIPTTHVIGDGSNTAIGNIEAGIVGKTDLGGFKFNYRFGVSAPTAAKLEGRGGLVDVYTNHYGTLADPSNLPAGMNDVLAIRTSASPEFELGPVFVRADVGTDILIGMGDNSDAAEVMLRINAAAGIDAGGVQLAVESANAFLLTESGTDPLSVIGVTASLPMDNVTVFGGVSVPLSSGLADISSQPFVVNTGVRISF